MNVAASCPPSAPPRVRITVFMPVATPVWLDGTAWTMRLPSAANARPMPIPSSDAEISMSYGWPWATASQPNATPVIALPAISAVFDPNRWASRPANGPEHGHPGRGRHQVQARDDDRGAEPEPGARRQLGELREDDERRVHPGAEQKRDQVRRPHAADPHHRHVDQRLAAVDLDPDPRDAITSTPRRRTTRSSWSRPSPRRSSARSRSARSRSRALISAAASQFT